MDTLPGCLKESFRTFCWVSSNFIYKGLKIYGRLFSAIIWKCISVLPSEVQGSIGSRVYFGCASHGQLFLYGKNLKWKQGIVLFLGLAKNSYRSFLLSSAGDGENPAEQISWGKLIQGWRNPLDCWGNVLILCCRVMLLASCCCGLCCGP